MKNFAALAALTFAAFAPAAQAAETAQTVQAATETSAPVSVAAGKKLYGPAGTRIASIYSVRDGNPQIIVNSRLITVPASTLSEVEGKITTSLTKREIVSAK